MISQIITFIAMLNPFALFLYLEPIMKELDHKDFIRVLVKASLISLFVYYAFLLFGNFVFAKIFHINFESFRIFGGIVIFSFAYFFIVKGEKAFIMMKSDLDDLASEIALPFMVGAGTISLAILMNSQLGIIRGLIAVAIAIIINFILILILKATRDEISKKKFKVAFDKNMEILLRLNGFIVGAIGIDMVCSGIITIFF